MKYIIIIICSIIVPVFSLKEITPKLCVNCKFFTNSFANDNKYGQCSLFPKKEKKKEFLATGQIQNVEYKYCSVARYYDDMCGKEGKLYKNKND
jgi:hypothetical protein